MHATQLVEGEALHHHLLQNPYVEQNAFPSIRLRPEAAYVQVQAMYWRPSIIYAAELLRLAQLASFSPRTKMYTRTSLNRLVGSCKVHACFVDFSQGSPSTFILPLYLALIYVPECSFSILIHLSKFAQAQYITRATTATLA